MEKALMDFVALDVETANADVGSICQIGLAGFQDGVLCRQWASLINPEEDFSAFNIQVHGLTAREVAGAPTLPEVSEILRTWLNRQVVVCHTLFDQRALSRAFAKYNLPMLDCRWLDSRQVARETWASLDGYSLAVVCGLLGYEFKHHDALEDAKAAGEIVLAAGRRTGKGPAAWLEMKEAQPAPPMVAALGPAPRPQVLEALAASLAEYDELYRDLAK
jgi:DNA polymerase-3 subunit epsilon